MAVRTDRREDLGLNVGQRGVVIGGGARPGRAAGFIEPGA
jgi:hypothetical protein